MTRLIPILLAAAAAVSVAATALADIPPTPRAVAGLYFARDRPQPSGISRLRLQGCEEGHPNCTAAKAAAVIGAVVVSIDGSAATDALAADAAFGRATTGTVSVVFLARDGTDRRVSVLFVSH
jgi:hypothetical protein